MEPRKICELGKRLGVINNANEEIILEKLKEMEGSVGERNKAKNNIVDQ